jgi:hypothetical protein
VRSWAGQKWHRPPRQIGLLRPIEEQDFAAAFNGARPLSALHGFKPDPARYVPPNNLPESAGTPSTTRTK